MMPKRVGLVEHLVEGLAAGAGFFESQDNILDAVVGVGVHQHVGHLDDVGRVGAVGHAHAVAECFDDDGQQLEGGLFAYMLLDLEQLGGG